MAAASSSTAAATHLLYHFLRPTPSWRPPLFISHFTRPLSAAATPSRAVLSNYQLQKYPTTTTTAASLFFSSIPLPLLFSSSISSLSPPPSKTLATTDSLSIEQKTEEEDDDFIGDDFDDEAEDIEIGREGDEGENGGGEGGSAKEGLKLKTNGSVKIPTLTVKEKKELAAYAHGLGKKLKCQRVGKSGVTDSVVSSFIETLEANELLKIKIHRTCPGELEEVMEQLEKATGSVVVGQIGRTVIVYRPSLTKMKAEEKKLQARRVFVRKEAKLKPVLPSRGQVPRLSGRGRRGSSRMS